ncbi:preprotein translocase subunit SecA [Rubripirellula reticaptiva]|uniref:Preprotein translocase subunit SecA n=1 Tax=Rubripirellula reticaptiva TaxID=2528013 RepID=A0A5C6F1L4_9BACT|nr:DEAD/DEAH box helicase [Rubripirellula reticaptiva]TWU55733.1 preprotein translocase subunit SecA [Rubripirellula reticaptiva]
MIGHGSESPRVPESIIEEVSRAAESHLDVTIRLSQISAGHHMMSRSIVEMPTGEGKTLATVLPAVAFVRRGRRVWIATANDYLAARDADWMRPVYQELGISVSAVVGNLSSTERAAAYSADVTYGTIRSFGFDFLRSELQQRHLTSNVRETSFDGDVLILDEADSLLIDEARTPMVISEPHTSVDRSVEASIRWSACVANELVPDSDFVFDHQAGLAALTAAGRKSALCRPMPASMRTLTTTEILHTVEIAILVAGSILPDVHYVVDDRRIKLVDEYTGRKSTNRTFNAGLQQAIEAREGLTLTPPSDPVARIAVQDFVAKFRHLCGLTATAWEDRQELRNVYDLAVHRVAPERLSRRDVWPVCCFASSDEKRSAIARETVEVVGAGRAVLIGTRTIEQSVTLSEHFDAAGITHQLLTARNLESEAMIVAEAGQAGRVTIATNLAGRGTDIALSDEVRSAGGLHVIVSEPHASTRIDRQLIGRGARQGDPGSSRIFGGAEDAILWQAFGRAKADEIQRQAADAGKRAAPDLSWLRRRLARAQAVVTRMHRSDRRRLAVAEANLAVTLRGLGLDPHLDPLPSS